MGEAIIHGALLLLAIVAKNETHTRFVSSNLDLELGLAPLPNSTMRREMRIGPRDAMSQSIFEPLSSTNATTSRSGNDVRCERTLAKCCETCLGWQVVVTPTG